MSFFIKNLRLTSTASPTSATSPNSPITPACATSRVVDFDVKETSAYDDINKIITSIDEESLREHGYKMIRKISNTIQGVIYSAVIINTNQKVCIKQTNKSLHSSQEAIQDDMRVFVDQNIIKESQIIKYLTKSNNAYVAKYIDFFQDNSNYYLVQEYIGDYNLHQFIQICHLYIKQKKLSLNEYKKVAKFLCWQITASVAWLHDDMNTVHHNLSMENIMLKNSSFVQHNNGTVSINPNICTILVDFGLAEIFNPRNNEYKSFKCSFKRSFAYTSPSVYNQVIYDASAEDVWSLGILFYAIFTGKCLYIRPELNYDDGYNSIVNKTILEYVKMNHLTKYFSSKILGLLYNILNINEMERYSAKDVLKSDYFQKYYNKYSLQMDKYSLLQKQLNKIHYAQISFYSINKNIV